jgi:hypothetical protein
LIIGSILESWEGGDVKIGWSKNDGWIELLGLTNGGNRIGLGKG